MVLLVKEPILGHSRVIAGQFLHHLLKRRKNRAKIYMEAMAQSPIFPILAHLTYRNISPAGNKRVVVIFYMSRLRYKYTCISG